MANNDQPQPRTIIGSISEFQPEKEQWVNYKRRLDAWMRINKIDDGDKVDAFISLVDPSIPCQYRRENVRPAVRTRYQKESETVSDYIVALKKLSIHSGFGDEEQVKKRLRNRLVEGVRSDAIKNRLLSEGAALTWDKAVEISTSMDTAHQNSKMMKPAEELNSKGKSAEEVNRVQRGGHQYNSRGRDRDGTREKCYRCHSWNHEAFKCPYKDEKCYKCNRFGHIARACENETAQEPQQVGRGGEKYSRGSPQSGRGRGRWQGRGRGHGHVHYANVERPEEEVSYAALYEVRPSVEEEDPESSVVEDTPEVVKQESLFDVKPSGGEDKEIRVDVEINGHSMPFTIDTASAVSIVGEDTYYKYRSHLQLQEPQINLKGCKHWP